MVATVDIIEIAKATGCKAHICHVSSPDVAQKIKEAQQGGYDITEETCSHYLSLTEKDLLENGPLFKCAPPLRSQEEVDRLWSYVEDGTFSGIQSGFQVAFYEGCVKRGISPSVLAKAMAVQPAKAFGIYGKKGDIKSGFDADLVIIDPDRPWEITGDSLYYVNKISAFVGRKGKGLPVLTMVRGNVVAKDGKLTGRKGSGRLVKRIDG